MSHLVGAIKNEPVGQCLAALKQAHEYLARQGAEALRRAVLVSSDGSWGASVKRIYVQFDTNPRPKLIPEEIEQHSLVEIINQCATLERLIDVLEWLKLPGSELNAFQTVMRCHPTTSSEKGKNKADNDLIVAAPDGTTAKFEVSDVSSEQDGNGKERKDLISLGVLTSAKGDGCLAIKAWPEARLFLVLSKEFAAGVLRRIPLWRKRNHCQLKPAYAKDHTRIFEVIRSPAVARGAGDAVGVPSMRIPQEA